MHDSSSMVFSDGMSNRNEGSISIENGVQDGPYYGPNARNNNTPIEEVVEHLYKGIKKIRERSFLMRKGINKN
jgi:hypothetical protein